jgi:hypothetical protein
MKAPSVSLSGGQKPVGNGAWREVCRKPNPAVMATVTSKGRPVSVATWYLIEEDGPHAVHER